jgi:hypothetical protein
VIDHKPPNSDSAVGHDQARDEEQRSLAFGAVSIFDFRCLIFEPIFAIAHRIGTMSLGEKRGNSPAMELKDCRDSSCWPSMASAS